MIVQDRLPVAVILPVLLPHSNPLSLLLFPPVN
jgi:hypothetical protein